MADSDWRVGSKLVHPYDPDLGTGVVRSVEGRFLQVYFPAAERQLTLSAAAGLRRLVLDPGQWAVVLDSDEEVEIEETLGHEYRLSDGRVVGDAELWPLVPPDSPVERLARLEVDAVRSFKNRVDGLRLMEMREAGGLGSFLGGRIELFPHQLHTALGAVQRDPVRWLLADEVGLGKTIEACLILSALVRTGRARTRAGDRSGARSRCSGWASSTASSTRCSRCSTVNPSSVTACESDYGAGVEPVRGAPELRRDRARVAGLASPQS